MLACVCVCEECWRFDEFLLHFLSLVLFEGMNFHDFVFRFSLICCGLFLNYSEVVYLFPSCKGLQFLQLFKRHLFGERSCERSLVLSLSDVAIDFWMSFDLKAIRPSTQENKSLLCVWNLNKPPGSISILGTI